MRKRIMERQELINLAQELKVRPDWHEPDEQDVDVVVNGNNFDNAGFWPECSYSGILEHHVTILHEGCPVAAVNLATLLAWATGWEG